MKRHPITRRNSTVLGGDVRGPLWDRWWRDARWDAAVPTRGEWPGVLNVPVPDADDPYPIDERAWYRVRPRREGKARPVRIGGVWHWEYA